MADDSRVALLSQRAGRQDAEKLTDREVEVLRLIGQGLANKAIARRLKISEGTVKAHLTSIFARTGAADRHQAALWAQRQGLVDGP